MASQIMSPKRKAIADSKRIMFIWVAGMSAVVGVCVVVSIFMVQQIMFKSKVISTMSHTVSVLDSDIKNANSLAQNIVALEANPALNSAKTDDNERALQVPLDALPADRNTLALGSSLQQSLLADIPGLTVDSLSIDNAAGLSNIPDNSIPVAIQLSATNANTIKQMLLRLESSIRVIDIDSFVLEKGDNNYRATITAHAYYQPAVQFSMGTKVIRPGGTTK